MHHRVGIANGTMVITIAKSNGSAREGKRSRIDSVLPLKVEAPAGRKIFLWVITSNVLAIVHASLDVVFGSKSKGKRSYTITRAEVGADVIPRLSFEDVFIARVGCRWIF